MSLWKLPPGLEKEIGKLTDSDEDASFTKKGEALMKFITEPANWARIVARMSDLDKHCPEVTKAQVLYTIYTLC